MIATWKKNDFVHTFWGKLFINIFVYSFKILISRIFFEFIRYFTVILKVSKIFGKGFQQPLYCSFGESLDEHNFETSFQSGFLSSRKFQFVNCQNAERQKRRRRWWSRWHQPIYQPWEDHCLTRGSRFQRDSCQPTKMRPNSGEDPLHDQQGRNFGNSWSHGMFLCHHQVIPVEGPRFEAYGVLRHQIFGSHRRRCHYCHVIINQGHDR